MNPTPRTRPQTSTRRPAALAAALLMLPLAASAETTFIPYLSSTTLFDSNVYRVRDRSQIPDEPNRAKTDFIFTHTAGLESAFTWSQQRLFSTIEGSRFDYLRNTVLDQNAFRLAGGLEWSLFDRVKGTLTAGNSRTRSSFANADTTVLNTQRLREFGASLNFLVTNDVRFTGSYANNVSRLPAIDAPTLRLEENTSTAALEYIGINRWALGLFGSYGFGDYSGIGLDSSFEQYSGAATLGYEASGLSRFRFSAGYTQREDAVRGGKTGGFTGGIGYSRELTGKTSVDLSLDRVVESFPAGDNSVVGTSVNAAMNWDATAKITTTLTYNYTRSAFRTSPGAVENVFTGRTDHQHTVNLQATYQALRWLSVRPVFGFERRTTTIPVFDFNALQGSVQFEARFL